MATTDPLVQLSSRGQVTLPAPVRKALGLHSGDAFRVQVMDGRVVLEPVEVLPVELYTDERVEEFERAAALTDEEFERARRAWSD